MFREKLNLFFYERYESNRFVFVYLANQSINWLDFFQRNLNERDEEFSAINFQTTAISVESINVCVYLYCILD